MYVCKYVQVILPSPTHIVGALHLWAPWLEHQGGTAIGWVSPCCLVSRGGTRIHMYIYIYMSVSLSVCAVAAKTRRPFFGLRVLASDGTRQSLCRGSLALLLLPATCRAAAAFAARRCAGGSLTRTCFATAAASVAPAVADAAAAAPNAAAAAAAADHCPGGPVGGGPGGGHALKAIEPEAQRAEQF